LFCLKFRIWGARRGIYIPPETNLLFFFFELVPLGVSCILTWLFLNHRKTISVECSHVCSVDYHPQKQHILVRVEFCVPHYNMWFINIFWNLRGFLWTVCVCCWHSITNKLILDSYFNFCFPSINTLTCIHAFFHVYCTLSLQKQLPYEIVVIHHLLFVLPKLNFYVLYRLLLNMSLGYIFGI